MEHPLILASSSPRRRALLRRAGIRFCVMPARVSERLAGTASPRETAMTLALRKARAVARRMPGRMVLGADTVVALKGRIIGKPRGTADAARILGMLSGSSHRVVTGVALMNGRAGSCLVRAATSTVYFRRIPLREIPRLARRHLDKAGAYAIQSRHDRFVRRFTGDYDTIVGLPVRLVRRMLAQARREGGG